MASSKKRTSYSKLHVLVLTLIAGVFALMGTMFAIQLLLRMLPTTEIKVEFVERDTREGAGYVGRGSGLGSESYFITVRDKDGRNYTTTCPEALYNRALSGISKLSSIRMKQSSLAGKPVEISVATSVSSLVKPGSIVHKLINMESKVTDKGEKATRYSLLMPLPGALFGFVFSWLVFAIMIWKLPNKNKFNWVVFSPGILLFIIGGSYWLLAM